MPFSFRVWSCCSTLPYLFECRFEITTFSLAARKLFSERRYFGKSTVITNISYSKKKHSLLLHYFWPCCKGTCDGACIRGLSISGWNPSLSAPAFACTQGDEHETWENNEHELSMSMGISIRKTCITVHNLTIKQWRGHCQSSVMLERSEQLSRNRSKYKVSRASTRKTNI